jgi:hypothetical protein
MGRGSIVYARLASFVPPPATSPDIRAGNARDARSLVG